MTSTTEQSAGDDEEEATRTWVEKTATWESTNTLPSAIHFLARCLEHTPRDVNHFVITNGFTSSSFSFSMECLFGFSRFEN
jgi:hypothetical protein